LLTVVDVTDLIDAVATHPYVAATLVHDPDDVPLATLAVLLGQRALSEDLDLGAAGTGRPWLAHVVAVTDAVMSDRTTAALAWGGVGTVYGVGRTGKAAYGGLQRALGTKGATILALVLAGLIICVLLYPRSRRWLAAIPPVQVAGKALGTLAEGTMAIVLQGTQGDPSCGTRPSSMTATFLPWPVFSATSQRPVYRSPLLRSPQRPVGSRARSSRPSTLIALSSRPTTVAGSWDVSRHPHRGWRPRHGCTPRVFSRRRRTGFPSPRSRSRSSRPAQQLGEDGVEFHLTLPLRPLLKPGGGTATMGEVSQPPAPISADFSSTSHARTLV
jgi:hypothetical protein